MKPGQHPALQLALALLLGLCGPLALAPVNLPVIGLLSVAGFASLCYRQRPKALLRLAYTYGFGLYAAGASWVYVSINTYGQAPMPLAVIMTLAFVAFLALCFALPLLILAWARSEHPLFYVVAFPSAWLLSEWFRGWFLTGFPWLYLGHGHTDTWLAGWAPVTGVLGISWIAALSAATLWLLISRTGTLKLRAGAATATLALWLAGLGLGTVDWTETEPEPLQVAMIQPSLSLHQKWDNTALRQILDLYQQQTEPLLDHDLIIWPESAIPRLLDEVRGYLVDLDSTVLDRGTTLITGIPTRQGRDIYNSVVVLGDGSGIYHKQQLVPFGEYVPLEQWLRGLIHFFDLPMSSFSRGSTDQRPLRAGDHNIATAICYEIVYQDMVAANARDAQLLLTVSNDTWFGESFGPHQHFQIARMRAIENRKPLLRGTNDGITAIVDSRGQVTHSLPQFKPGTLSGEVTARSGTTPFNHTGSWPALLLSLALLAISVRRLTPTP